MPHHLADAFAQYYQGRHQPQDALWWLDHPAEPGPSSAPPVQDLFLVAAEQLDDAGLHEAAHAMREALADVLAFDRRTTLDALAQQHHDATQQQDPPPYRADKRSGPKPTA